MKRQAGFTLIELVVVIVILGILAAFALPRFANLSSDARTSAIQGLAGSIRSANALAHAQALAQGQTGATGTVTMEGQAINLVYGYPAATAAGITVALQSIDGFNPVYAAASTPPTATYDNGAATTTSCQVVFTEAANATTPPVVTTTVTDCN